MKAIFIAYDQAHQESILEILDRSNCRGFTRFDEVKGRGSCNGEPHYGTHAWPSLAAAIITIVPDDKVADILNKLKSLDINKPRLGLRAFAWEITDSI